VRDLATHSSPPAHESDERQIPYALLHRTLFRKNVGTYFYGCSTQSKRQSLLPGNVWFEAQSHSFPRDFATPHRCRPQSSAHRLLSANIERRFRMTPCMYSDADHANIPTEFHITRLTFRHSIDRDAPRFCDSDEGPAPCTHHEPCKAWPLPRQGTFPSYLLRASTICPPTDFFLAFARREARTPALHRNPTLNRLSCNTPSHSAAHSVRQHSLALRDEVAPHVGAQHAP
jgi:hypothetical protein